MEYRKDINGIRAIAIIGIVLFHLNINFFQGAIICIDIFFVLSGYLITTVILKKENKFNIYLFWVNRARRLFPLLLFVIFATIPFAIYMLVPLHLKNYSQSLLTTPVFLSNVLFWLESGYWDLPSQMKPLLHTWSIAIEGQFYFVFPLIFLIRDNKKILIIIILLWLLSLLMALFHESELIEIQTDKFLSLADHFMPFGRWWELMTGSFVAFVLNKKKYFKLQYHNAFSILGLGLVLFSIFFFNNKHILPGPLSIIPVAGTALLILYSVERNLVYKFLNLRLLNHLGEISYSIYLWHFPILVFTKYAVDQNLTNINKISIILLTYLISLISYKYIEIPFYKKKILSNKIFIIFTLISITILCTFGMYLNYNYKNFSQLGAKTEKIKNKFSQYKFGETPLDSIYDIEKNFSDHINKKKILIIGDSHARDLTRALISFKENNKLFEFSFMQMNDFLNYNKKTPKTPKTKKNNQRINSAEYVFLSRQFTSEKNQIKSIKTINKLVKNLNKTFVIVGSAPEFYTSEGDLLLTFLIENEKNIDYLMNKNYQFINRYFYLNLKSHLFNINVKLKNLAKDLNVNYLDRFDFTCDLKDNYCWAFDDRGKKNFFDYSHFTTEGMIFFGKKIHEINWLENAMNN